MTEPRSTPRRSGGELRPTPRFWWLVLVLIVAALAVLWAIMSQRPAEEYSPAPAVPASPTPTPTPAIPEIARQEVWTSDTKASGTYLTNTISLEPGIVNPEVIDWAVQVEDTTELDADEVAREIQATFDDERGWAGYGKRTFRLTTDVEEADLVIHVASPDTTYELCLPMDVGTKWNCRNGRVVALNSDRWKYMTPTYDDLNVYRSYLVNHEVGHFLGFGHVSCPAEGGPAPVMMQQSIEMGGCTANAWPKLAD